MDKPIVMPVTDVPENDRELKQALRGALIQEPGESNIDYCKRICDRHQFGVNNGALIDPFSASAYVEVMQRLKRQTSIDKINALPLWRAILVCIDIINRAANS